VNQGVNMKNGVGSQGGNVKARTGGEKISWDDKKDDALGNVVWASSKSPEQYRMFQKKQPSLPKKGKERAPKFHWEKEQKNECKCARGNPRGEILPSPSKRPSRIRKRGVASRQVRRKKPERGERRMPGCKFENRAELVLRKNQLD